MGRLLRAVPLAPRLLTVASVAGRYDSWESYFYPETVDPVTHEGTLRNLYGERDAKVLARLEYIETTGRAVQIHQGKTGIAKTYDADHVRAIHQHLFQDVYEWAGEYRTVNLFKDRREFADVKAGQIERYLGSVHRQVSDIDWGTLDRDGFGSRAASVFASLNQAHPFREGNGRMSKVFMEHVAKRSRFSLDFARVSPQVWNQLSMLSGPDLGKFDPVSDSLVPMFRHIAVERENPSLPGTEAADRARSLSRASFPQSPTQATAPRSANGGQGAPYKPLGRYGSGQQRGLER